MPKNPDPFPEPQSKPAVGPVRLADALGWASAALGAPMLISRRGFLRAIGVRADSTAQLATLGVGVREFTAFGTIVPMRHRRVGAWSRVSGDLMDLGLLGAAYSTRREHTGRLLAFGGLVASILAADLFTALQLGRAEGTHVKDGSTSSGTSTENEAPGGPTHMRTAITVRGAKKDVTEAFLEFGWSGFDPRQLLDTGRVRFVEAPRERGVEIHLDFEPGVIGGAVGAAALKLAGQSPDQKTNDELRRFKCLIETGVEVRSDKTRQGHSALGQILQRPGQPVGGRA